MGTRLTVVLETEMSMDELREAVHLIDADLDPDPIAPENVSAWDVIQCVCAGDLSLVPIAYRTQWGPDGVPDLRGAINEAGGDMHRALDGVVVNKMEPIK